ncbi:MAG: hypothetical protein PWP66_355 [Thermosediminibacterales bacterium]|nr:hypothetical protein [Thermosediminibacterales bacterium]
MEIFTVFLLALAISVDAFMTGVSYGMREINIPPLSLTVISIITISFLLIAMKVGIILSTYLSSRLAVALGALILISVGLSSVYKVHFSDHKNGIKPLLHIKIKSLGLIIKILKEPVKADMDISGDINLKEAWLLGTALALDSLGAGLGAGVTGYNLWLTVLLTSVFTPLAIITGIKIGRFVFNYDSIKNSTKFLPGIILVLIGILRIL